MPDTGWAQNITLRGSQQPSRLTARSTLLPLSSRSTHVHVTHTHARTPSSNLPLLAMQLPSTQLMQMWAGPLQRRRGGRWLTLPAWIRPNSGFCLFIYLKSEDLLGVNVTAFHINQPFTAGFFTIKLLFKGNSPLTHTP